MRWWQLIGPQVKSLATTFAKDDQDRIELTVAVSLVVIHLVCMLNGRQPSDVEKLIGDPLWATALGQVQAVTDYVADLLDEKGK